MGAKLIKSEYYHYILEDNNGNLIGSISDNDSIYKLSLKNCEAIENGYDLDELAKEASDGVIENHILAISMTFFKAGFKKALEVISDKKFGEADIYNALDFARANGKYRYEIMSDDDFIQSLQQTEWEVTFNPDEKDSNGCLILKRK